jgi:hypothetical protein
MKWLKNLLKNKQVIKVKSFKIRKPKKNEILLFKFPEGTSEETIISFKERFEEELKRNSSKETILFTSIKFDIVCCDKNKVKIK